MSAELVRTESVDRVLRSIRRADRPPLPIPNPMWRAVRLPAARVMWLGGLGPMEPSLRARLGVRWTRRDELAFRAIGKLTRRLDPVMPRQLKVMGFAQLRWRAAAIARGPLGAGAGAAVGEGAGAGAGAVKAA